MLDRGGGFKSLFGHIWKTENLFKAWELFKRGKTSRDDVKKFSRNLEEHIYLLQNDLRTGVYRHGPYERFVVHDPKQRTIHKAQVRDRVVHQAIVNVIEPIFEKRFIHDSYSCRVSKGTHAAVTRFRSFLRSASVNNTRTVYILKCDVKKFFAAVDHQILLDLLRRHIDDGPTNLLLEYIVHTFSSSEGKGIPLGNLTSQLFANVYLHELDWYVKQTLRIQHYVRYCDDFVIITQSRDEAWMLAQKIEEFLHGHLTLDLHPNKVSVRTWKQGVDFLGYVLLPHATILRPKTAYRAIGRVSEGNMSSYLGLCSHADAYELSCLLKNISKRTVGP
ncbi:MAG: reverse transcriptase domain-containing protein [Patescibacteria group bacterium]